MQNSAMRDGLTRYIHKTYGAKPDFPWLKYPGYAVFRHGDNKKWFAVILDVPRQKLGLKGDGAVDIINLKCGQALLGSLLMTEGFLPAYHMNKEHWVSVLLDGTVDKENICGLIDVSFMNTGQKTK